MMAEKEKKAAAQSQEKSSETAEERVKLRIPFVRGAAEDDVLIGLNGKMYQIKRGVEVEVPAGVAEIYYRSQSYQMAETEYIGTLKGTGAPEVNALA